MRVAVTAGRTIRQLHTPARPLTSVPRGDPPTEVVP
jgi:hypothetical protein